jgi:Chain length determinant protein
MDTENNPPIFNSGNLLSFVFSRWKSLLFITLIAFAGSVVVSLILPEKFKATVTLFPSQNNNISRAFLSEQSDDTKDFLAFGEDNNAEQLLQILKSDELMYALEKKFNLVRYYNLQDKWDKYYLFKGYYNDLFDYKITEYESVEINVYDQSPKMAAQMANEAAHLADSLIQQIIRQRTVAAYKIVKAQYDSAVEVANKLGDSLNFYHSKGILQLPYQVKELTSGYADAVVKGNAEAVKTISDKLMTFQQYGTGFLRITNELEASYEWFKQARASYMQAKVNAEQTIPSFFIADKAVPADRKTFPVRGLVVAGGTLTALIFSILLLLLLNRIKTLKKK